MSLEFLETPVYTDTDAIGRQVFLGIGDSKSQGTSSALGVTVAAGVMWNYNRNGFIDPVTNTDVLYYNSLGSQWPRFGTDYNTLTGNHVVFVNGGQAGSTCFDRGASNGNWGPTGTLYNKAVQYANNALQLLGLTKIKGVIITLGINDYAANETATQFSTGFTSLITRLNSTFGNPNIYISIPCSQSAYATNDQKLVDFRTTIKNLESTYSNVYVTLNECSLFNGGYNVDSLHFNAAGNDAYGAAVAAYIASTETDKDVRRMTTCWGGASIPSSSQKAAIKTFILAEKSNGNWPYELQVYKTGGLNKYNSFTGMNAPIANAAGLDRSNNGYIESNGGTGYLKSGFIPNLWTTYYGFGQNDFITGTGTVTLTTASGTLASLFGAGDGTSQRVFLKQDAVPGITYATGVNTTLTSTNDTHLLSNTDYAIQRSASTTSAILKNGSSLITTAQASSSFLSFEIWIGTSNGNSVSTNPIQCQYTYWFYAKNSTFNYSSFLTNISSLMNNL